MSVRIKIKEGDKFGLLTVIKEVEPNITPCGTVQRKFLCVCECGNQVVRMRRTLVKAAFSSCGCKSFKIGELNKKYTKEQTSSFLYSTWQGMKQRCIDPNSTSYHNYGGRGIKVCEEWLNDYTKFYYWALANGASKGLTLDRIDLHGDYEPSNCRWATAEEQQRNKRTNRIIEYNGVSKTLVEWSNELGIKEATIRTRLDKYGYTIAQALGFEPYVKKQYDRKHLRKKVMQYTLDGDFIREWDSVNDASENTGVSINSIRSCAYGEYKRGGGYIWKFTVPSKTNTKLSKKVLVYSQDGNIIAECANSREASILTGICVDSVRDMCKGKTKRTSKNLIFKFKDES